MIQKIKGKYKNFSYFDDGAIIYSESFVTKTLDKLEAGSYVLSVFNNKILLNVDGDIETPKPPQSFKEKDKMDYAFKAFFNKDIKNKIESLGFCHKIGVLLYGQEGTGKSTIMKYYYSKAIKENNALVFHISLGFVKTCWSFIQEIRKTQDNPIIIMFDEFEEFTSGAEGLIKTCIDGQKSINNSIFFAATNYIEKIPKALRNRPSRFKYVIEIGGIESVDGIIKIIKPLLEDILDEDYINKKAEEMVGNTLDTIKQKCFDEIMKLENYHINKTVRPIVLGFVNK